MPEKGTTDSAQTQANDSPPQEVSAERVERIDANGVGALRANTYSLLAAMLAAPVSQDMLERLKQIDADAAADGGNVAAAWHALKLAGQWATVELLDDEYHELFIGVGRGELMPYGSWYMTGFLMDRPLSVLRQDLASLGIERQEDVHEPEDHVAALCETMSLVINSGDEISWDRQRRFFGDHMAPWIGKFFADLQNAKAARFYRAVGQLGEQFVEIERRYLTMLT